MMHTIEHMLAAFLPGYLNRNITFAFFFFVVILARLALKSFPKKYSYMLWALLGIKAVTDFGVLSANRLLSLLSGPAVQAGTRTVTGKAVTEVPEGTITGVTFIKEVASKPGLGRVYPLFFAIWALGVVLLLFTGITGYAELSKKVKLSFSRGDLYVCDYIDSPMVFGIVRPRIYIPSGVETDRLEYVIRHERVHLRRGDTLFKLFAFAVLAFYWMNPLAWIAFKLFNLDMELSCDEAVLKSESERVKEDYGKWLVFFASKGKVFGPVPTAFGETDVEKRVKNMKNIKSIKGIAIIAATLIIIAVASVCLLKAPKLFAAPENASEAPAADTVQTENVGGTGIPGDAENTETGYTPGVYGNGENIVQENADTTLATDQGDVTGTLRPTDTEWLWPLEDYWHISQSFGAEGTTFSDEEDKEVTVYHPAVDIAAPMGTAVLASRSGTVAFAGWESRETGNVVLITVDDTTTVKYAHMDSVCVNTGDSVTQGTKVGEVGSTGQSTGPHLCYRIDINGESVDPMQFYEIEEE